MAGLKIRYPNLYRVLVAERNQVLAKNLTQLIQTHPEKKIVAVVGAGHETEIINQIQKNLLSQIDD